MLLKTLYLYMILLVLPSPMTTTAPRLCNFLFCMLDELDEDRYIDAPYFLYIYNNCIGEVY
jgi:hypothetical protein